MQCRALLAGLLRAAVGTAYTAVLCTACSAQQWELHIAVGSTLQQCEDETTKHQVLHAVVQFKFKYCMLETV